MKPVALLAAALLVAPGLAWPSPPGEARLRLATPAAVLELDARPLGGALVGFTLPGGLQIAAEDGARGMALVLEGSALPLEAWELRRAALAQRADGAAVAELRWEVGPAAAPLLALERRVTLLPDVAAAVLETSLLGMVPLYLTDYRLLSVALAPSLAGARLQAHDYNGGADWNDVFHRERDASPPFEGRAQLLHAQVEEGPGLVLTLVRRGAEASRLQVEGLPGGARASLHVNLSRELVTTGPVAPYALHAGALPGGLGVRGLPLRPGATLRLEPVLLAAGRGELEALWAHHKLLAFEAPGRFTPSVAYNTNVWDARGEEQHPAADLEEQVFLQLYEAVGSTPYSLMNRSAFQREVPLAALAGVDTFVLDDGWQYLSGDWNPHPAKFPGGLGPERGLLAQHDMTLGLWMSPLEFNARSRTMWAHPHWVCHPVGAATALVPNQAGLGVWNILAPGFREHLLGEVQRMADEHGARHLKFDFATWVDCAASPATIHEYAMAFRDVLAALRAARPDIVLQMDETNDHRFFAFESVWHGPSWFKNGNPSVAEELGMLASLAPFVPLHTVGVPVLNGKALQESDALHGPASLWGHPTLWSRLSDVPAERLAAFGAWARFYRGHRELFEGLTLRLDAPSETWALERVRPDLGLALVAVLDPDGRIPAGGEVTLRARLPCDGDVEVSDPLGSWRQVVASEAGSVRLPLRPVGGAASAVLRCLPAG